jgi:hypothetical protein
MLTPPVEFALSVVAVVSDTEIPPVPEVSVSVGVSNSAVVMPPVVPVADNEIEVVAVRAPARFMLPPVEVKLTVGDVRLVSPASVIEAREFTFTTPAALLPVIVPPRLTAPPVEVKFTVSAVIVPLFVSVLSAERVRVPIFPLPATMFPATVNEPAGIDTENVDPLPAEELLIVIVPAVLPVKDTEPVEFADRVVAEVEATVVPPVPDVTVRFGVVNVPVVTLPAPVGLADNVKVLLAESGLVKVMLPPVELRLTLAAEMLLSPESVMPALETMLTRPVAPVPVTVSPSDTEPFCAVSVTVLA